MSEKEVYLRCLDDKIDELLVVHFVVEYQVVDKLRNIVLKIISLFVTGVEM